MWLRFENKNLKRKKEHQFTACVLSATEPDEKKNSGDPIAGARLAPISPFISEHFGFGCRTLWLTNREGPAIESLPSQILVSCWLPIFIACAITRSPLLSVWFPPSQPSPLYKCRSSTSLASGVPCWTLIGPLSCSDVTEMADAFNQFFFSFYLKFKNSQRQRLLTFLSVVWMSRQKIRNFSAPKILNKIQHPGQFSFWKNNHHQW